MRPINQLPIKIGETYFLACHYTGHGPFFKVVKVLHIKEGKLKRYYHPNNEFYSIKVEIINTNGPDWSANPGAISWIHHEGLREMNNRWLIYNKNCVIQKTED